VCLPSKHQGGLVRLSHHGQSEAFDTSESVFDVSIFVWFDNLTHKIKKVTEWYLIVFIYNIIRGGIAPVAISAESLVQQDERLMTALVGWTTLVPASRHIAYFLDHKYSQTSLRADHLNGLL